MSKIILIAKTLISFRETIEEISKTSGRIITFEDLVELDRFLNNVPDSIKKSREEFEKLGEALTALSFGKEKVIFNNPSGINPHERQYKNKRKW